MESNRKVVPAGQRDQSAAALPITGTEGADLDLPALVMIVVVVRLSDIENGCNRGE